MNNRSAAAGSKIRARSQAGDLRGPVSSKTHWTVSFVDSMFRLEAAMGGRSEKSLAPPTSVACFGPALEMHLAYHRARRRRIPMSWKASALSLVLWRQALAASS